MRPVGDTPASPYLEAARAALRSALAALDVHAEGPPMARVGDREAAFLALDVLVDRDPHACGILDMPRVTGATHLRVINGGGQRG